MLVQWWSTHSTESVGGRFQFGLLNVMHVVPNNIKFSILQTDMMNNFDRTKVLKITRKECFHIQPIFGLR
jgi:hypothetical protein